MTALPAVGTRHRLDFTIDAAAMEAFARLSGDRNPLHGDDAFARAKGFDGRVVYGGLIVAQVSRLLGMDLPGRDGLWTGLSMDFRKPLYIGEPATLDAEVTESSPATGLVRLAFTVRAGDRTLARGRAESLLRP